MYGMLGFLFGQTDRQTDIQTDRQTYRQTDRHTYRQTDKGEQTIRQTVREALAVPFWRDFFPAASRSKTD